MTCGSFAEAARPARMKKESVTNRRWDRFLQLAKPRLLRADSPTYLVPWYEYPGTGSSRSCCPVGVPQLNKRSRGQVYWLHRANARPLKIASHVLYLAAAS